MKNLLTIILVLLTFTISAQQRDHSQKNWRGDMNEKCITISVEKFEEHKVKITTINTCKEVTIVKTMLKKDWDRMIALRNKKLKQRRNWKHNPRKNH